MSSSGTVSAVGDTVTPGVVGSGTSTRTYADCPAVAPSSRVTSTRIHATPAVFGAVQMTIFSLSGSREPPYATLQAYTSDASSDCAVSSYDSPVTAPSGTPTMSTSNGSRVGPVGVPVISSEGGPSVTPVRVAITRTVYSVPLMSLGIV